MSRGGRRRRLIHFSKLYSFSCIRPEFTEEHSQIGQKGFSRVVHCNDPDNPEAELVRNYYKGNYVSTTKYNAFNFIPKALFEQFRRVANIYFLIVACFSYTDLSPFNGNSMLPPLLLVTGATMFKEAVEDWQRRNLYNVLKMGTGYRSQQRKVKVYCRDHTFRETRWKKLRIGDLVKVEKDEFFPADLLLLSSSYEDGICYVETTNLDGETNLKVKQSLEVTSTLHDENSFQTFSAVIKCEDPNENLCTFIGTLHYDDSQYPLSPQNILLRDSKLRNTEYIYGVVIFTGHDTKVMQNATDPPSKRSKVEKKMDKIVYILFGILILISLIGSVVFGIETKDEKYKRWYLRPDNTTAFYDPRRASLAAIYQFLRGLMLYGYLIPISLYISIEIVKVLQSIFINQDLNTYYEETDRPSHARTSNLNEELGQVHTILSDKTGTLTCNSMEFIKCSIAGTSYGRGVTDVEKAMARVTNNARGKPVDLSSDSEEHNIDATSSKNPIKGFNFRDERIMNGQWVKEPDADIIQKFFRTLAICHTVVPDVNDESGEISYKAESPDEAAFVVTARELGFEFYERNQTSILLHELDPVTGKKVNRLYKLLHVLDFSSSRKRMSVIVRNEEGQVLLLCKGADSVMFERLSMDCRLLEAKTRDHINKYAEEGLRTLVVAYREIPEEEFRAWQDEFLKAKTSLSADRDAMVDKLADTIERDLILLGATAVEDKLQKGVPECIDKLAQAGIKIWVLTGDKIETAANIGYACSLLRKEMHQIIITLDSADFKALEKQGDKSAVTKASHESIAQQLKEGKSQVSAAKQKSLACALIIVETPWVLLSWKIWKACFWTLQLIVHLLFAVVLHQSRRHLLVKMRTDQTTLAIGDGANDVGMLQEADNGVGISGVEGMQAVMTSDFAIAQFRFLERLLLVHGHWCYRRTTTMICYFFFKNVAFGFTLFWFMVYASFSGEPAYNDWFLSFYNVFFTSLPVIALGTFDQDVSARLCLKYPLLHQEGVQNILFSWLRILGWMFNGVYCSVIIFFFNIKSIAYQAFCSDGRVADYEVLGVVLYTCVVWTVNCQIVLTVNYFTWIHHLFIWGSILSWCIFLVIFGSVPPTISTTAYKVFVEACVPSALHWLTILLVVISCLLPVFLYKACEINFFPDYHHIIIHHEKSSQNRATEMRSEFSIENID